MRFRLMLLALAIAACSGSQRVTPKSPTQWVTDGVGLLSPSVRTILDTKLEAYEKHTGHQVIVWISDSTHGEPFGDFAIRVANTWGIGRAGKDDGVVLFVFTRDDMRWIWVGYGLQVAIPDKEAARICREVVRPKMHAGNADGGVAAGIEAILDAIDAWEKR